MSQRVKNLQLLEKYVTVQIKYEYCVKVATSWSYFNSQLDPSDSVKEDGGENGGKGMRGIEYE